MSTKRQASRSPLYDRSTKRPSTMYTPEEGEVDDAGPGPSSPSLPSKSAAHKLTKVPLPFKLKKSTVQPFNVLEASAASTSNERDRQEPLRRDKDEDFRRNRGGDQWDQRSRGGDHWEPGQSDHGARWRDDRPKSPYRHNGRHRSSPRDFSPSSSYHDRQRHNRDDRDRYPREYYPEERYYRPPQPPPPRDDRAWTRRDNARPAQSTYRSSPERRPRAPEDLPPPPPSEPPLPPPESSEPRPPTDTPPPAPPPDTRLQNRVPLGLPVKPDAAAQPLPPPPAAPLPPQQRPSFVKQPKPAVIRVARKREFSKRTPKQDVKAYGRTFLGCGDQSDYEVTKKLGEGTFGEVHKAIRKTTKEAVALKRILMHSEKEGMPVTALREIKILKALKHPSIVDIQDMFVVRSTGKEPLSVYMVFPYMDHDLAGLLENERVVLTPSQIKLYMKQLLEGTEYMHRNHILHRDMKAANLLISNTGTLRIADFGLARSFDANISKSNRKYTNCVVTRWYRPPELLLGARQYGGEVDIWGIGCVLGEMFQRRPILPGSSDLDQLEKIWYLCGTPTQHTWTNFDKLPGCEGVTRFNMYARRLKKSYETVGPETVDLLDKLLTCNPKDRITAAQALEHEYFWTEPLPADPTKLPSYEASHEFDKRGHRTNPVMPGGGPPPVQPPKHQEPPPPPPRMNMPPPPGQQPNDRRFNGHSNFNNFRRGGGGGPPRQGQPFFNSNQNHGPPGPGPGPGGWNGPQHQNHQGPPPTQGPPHGFRGGAPAGPGGHGGHMGNMQPPGGQGGFNRGARGYPGPAGHGPGPAGPHGRSMHMGGGGGGHMNGGYAQGGGGSMNGGYSQGPMNASYPQLPPHPAPMGLPPRPPAPLGTSSTSQSRVPPPGSNNAGPRAKIPPPGRGRLPPPGDRGPSGSEGLNYD